MDNNIINIQNTLSEITSKAGTSEFISIVNKLVAELSSYYDKLDNFYTRLSVIANQKQKVYSGMDASDVTISYAIFKELKDYNLEASNILKEGYVIIEELRKFFTGEEITYKIGIPYYSKVYEINLSLSQLLEIVDVDFNTKASDINNVYKLRVSASKGNILQRYAELKQEIFNAKESGSTLYSSVWHYIHDNETNHGKKYNKGNAFEAYQVYQARFKSNLIPPAYFNEEEFDKILTDVKGNIAAASLGGDLGTEQIKFYSSAPSLITTAQVRRVLAVALNSLRSYVSSKDSYKLQESLKKLFLKEGDKLIEEVDKAALDKATEYLEEVLKNFR